MIDSLVERIKISSSSVDSEEIIDTIKVASSLFVPTLAALGTGAMGVGATYLAMKRDRREEEEKARNKAIMYGLAGALGGFGVGKAAPSTQAFGSSPMSSDPGSMDYGFDDRDMQYIMGRR